MKTGALRQHIRSAPAFCNLGANLLAQPGRPYRPPLRRVFHLVRRAGCPHPAKPGRRNHQALGHRGPAMAACGHAALQGSARVRRESGSSGGYEIRPYRPACGLLVGAGVILARRAAAVGGIDTSPLRGSSFLEFRRGVIYAVQRSPAALIFTRLVLPG